MTTTAQKHLSGVINGANVFDRFADMPHEEVVFCQDRDSGLRAIIAVHDTTLGPAFGGTRFYPYPDEAAALTDVLRLSRGMTYKTAAVGLPCGGGKAVIIGDPTTVKTDRLLETYGRFIQSLGGRYVTAGDVGTSSDDLDVIGRSTDYVLGRNASAGGYGDSGPMTALGAFSAIRAGAHHLWGTDELTGRSIGVEGAGKVGYNLVKLLVPTGARITVADVAPESRARISREFPQVTVVERVIDLYAPCALGATLSIESIPSLQASLVCGAANNQLATPAAGQLLADRGITWVPDYVASAGGVTLGSSEYRKLPIEDVPEQVRRIFDAVAEILTLAAQQNILPGAAADALALARIDSARGKLKPGYLPDNRSH